MSKDKDTKTGWEEVAAYYKSKWATPIVNNHAEINFVRENYIPLSQRPEAWTTRMLLEANKIDTEYTNREGEYSSLKDFENAMYEELEDDGVIGPPAQKIVQKCVDRVMTELKGKKAANRNNLQSAVERVIVYDKSRYQSKPCFNKQSSRKIALQSLLYRLINMAQLSGDLAFVQFVEVLTNATEEAWAIRKRLKPLKSGNGYSSAVDKKELVISMVELHQDFEETLVYHGLQEVYEQIYTMINDHKMEGVFDQPLDAHNLAVNLRLQNISCEVVFDETIGKYSIERDGKVLVVKDYDKLDIYGILQTEATFKGKE